MPGPGGERKYAAYLSGDLQGEPYSGVYGRAGGNQVGVIYDLLSEGPIEGLVDTYSSIYFNGTPWIDPNSEAYKKQKSRRGLVTTTASSTTVNTDANFSLTEIDLTDGARYIHILGAGTNLTGNGSSTGATTTANNGIITTSASFFASTDADNTTGGLGSVYIRIDGAGVNGTPHVAKVVKYNSATEAVVSPPPVTAATYVTIVKDHVSEIASITDADTLVMADAAVTAQTDARAIISLPKPDPNAKKLTDDGFNFEHVSAFFRTGRQDQPVPQSFAGQIGSTYAKAFGEEIKQTTNTNLSITGQDVILKTALADLNIVDPGEIDAIRVVMEFPTLIKVSKNTANEYPARVEFQIWFEYYQGGTWKNTEIPVYGVSDEEILSRQWPGGISSTGGTELHQKINYGLGMSVGSFNSGVVAAQTKNRYLYEFPIDIEQFKPFSNFRVRIKRVTGNELLEHSKYQSQHQSRLNAIYAHVHDRQNYAHSAYAGVSFKASEFSAIPQRAYEIKGMKIQVPTNYITRDEASDGVAHYKRDIADGSTESTDQNWDGKFRGDITDSSWRSDPTHVNYYKVYCNNPAWVYYDIMLNDRYGLGDFLKAENIDKYQLYQIARYCDELVPDGEGGEEPRFTCNLYLFQKQEAYKVLSDMASIFRGMLHWMNSTAIAVQDSPKTPIYSFSKSNVKDGVFNYQSSSLRMRTNQCNVTWNDPKRFYKQYVEAVDDMDNIIDTGRVIPKSIVAMGCTSQGQANRLGRWTLLTERLEHELVSFSTGINASFLKPGDIVFIQDSDDSGVTASGRISNSGTRNTTTIPLDRTITLDNNVTYKLHLIYPKGGAYLNEDGPVYLSDASTTAYHRGDLVATAKIAGTTGSTTDIDDEDKASHVTLFNSPYTVQKTYWSPYSRTETKTVSTSAGNVSSLTVSSAFSSAPNAEVMWALTSDHSNSAKGARKFRIVSIKEKENTQFDITAQFYEDLKYDAVERGYEIYQRDYEPLPQKDHRVPYVQNINVKYQPISSAGTGEGSEEETTTLYNAIVSWEAPLNVADNDVYEFLKEYHILHNVTQTGQNSPIIVVDAQTTSYTVGPVVPGDYKFAVRVVSVLNQFGQWTEVGEAFYQTEKSSGQASIAKTTGLKQGGNITTSISLASTSVVTLNSGDYTITSPTGKLTTITSGTTTYNFNGLSDGETGYLLYDDSAGAWKMAEVYSDTTVLNAAGSAYSGGVNYWKEVATGSAGLTRVTAGNDALATVAITETVNSASLTKYGNTISVGTIKTRLQDEFASGDTIKLGTGTSAWYGTVKSVSDPVYFNPSIAVNTTNNTIKIPNNTLTKNQALYYQNNGGTTIGGLTNNTLYYVVDKDDSKSTFKLASSSGGTAISLTGTGSNVNQYLQSATATITTNESIFKAFDGSGADAYIYKLAFTPDTQEDFLYAKVVRTNSSTYTMTVLGQQPGTQGATGPQGAQGPQGGAGAVGLRTANGYLYYNTLQASAPSAPSNSSVQYAFSTGLLSGGVIGTGGTNWNQNAPASSGGQSSSKMWYVYWTTTEASAGGGTGTTVTLGSTVYNAHNFTGLVRFSGTNTLSDGAGTSTTALVAGDLGSSGTTIIDGGRIDTGTIDADRISTDLLRINGSNFAGDLDDGTVGGWDINSNDISGGSGDTYVALDQSNKKLRIGAKATLTDGNTGVHLGTDGLAIGANEVFKVTNAGVLTATSATITGAITATSGSFTGTVTASGGAIGGWDIASTTLSSGNITLDDGNNRIVVSD